MTTLPYSKFNRFIKDEVGGNQIKNKLPIIFAYSVLIIGTGLGALTMLWMTYIIYGRFYEDSVFNIFNIVFHWLR